MPEIFRRSLLLGAIIVLSAMLLGACSDDDGDGDDGAATPSGGAATPSDGATAPSGGASGPLGSVDVLGIWGGEELEKFEAMVEPWEAQEGGQVDFTGQRGVAALLTTRIEGGNPPDIAIPAEVGLFQDLAREGSLVPLSDCGLEEEILANYPQAFVDLGSVDGTLYAFFMKADAKGTIWYNPNTFAANSYEPLTGSSSWEDLIALSEQMLADGLAPWSMGVESEADSGWPGADWLQEIILNMDDGGALYDGLLDGSIPFTDDRVKAAWERFGAVAHTDGYISQGSTAGINATNFQDATFPPFQDPPAAGMVHLGAFASTFIEEQFPSAVAGEDFDFFPFPGGGVTGGANLVIAFNSDPATCSLLQYLVGADAQQIWVELGGFTSLNQGVALESYPDDTARAAAQYLLEAEAFRFGLADAIGGEVQRAIFTGVTEYLDNPGQLDAILASIEAAR